MTKPKTETTRRVYRRGQMFNPDPAQLEQIRSNLTSYMESMTRLLQMHKTGYTEHYRCIEDFVLQHGKFYPPAILPATMPYGPVRLCYMNAFQMANAFRGTLRYVEGYATAEGFPVLHGWCVDEDDRVYDPTWCWTGKSYRTFNIHGAGYYGVVLPLEIVMLGILLSGQYGVLEDGRNHYPILQQPFDEVHTAAALALRLQEKHDLNP